MSKSTKVTGLTSAASVRSFFRSNPEATAALSDAAAATVRPQDEGRTLRGRLHPEAIAAFNAANPATPYEFGAGRTKGITVKAVKFTKNAVRRPSVEVAMPEAREALALAGVEVGARGRLSAGQVETLGAMLVL